MSVVMESMVDAVHNPGRLDGELYQAKRFTTVRTQQAQACMLCR
jgi:hypothetical protein